jgi:hypothetical protein
VRGRLDRLRTLAEVNAVPHATRKDQLDSKLDRAIASKAARLRDVQQLRVWARAVKDRDRWQDRKTGHQVLATRQLDPRRAEAHHIASKDDRAVRYDVRNGICLSFATHFAIERHELRIEGTRWFTVGGARYIDATYAVYFVRL